MAARISGTSPLWPGRPGDPIGRIAHILPFAAIGTAGIIAGGIVAAVTAPAPTQTGTWAVAYLVLVVGVAQLALGAGQALLAPLALPSRLVLAELVLWNVANGAVLAGTLLGVQPLIDAGGGLLVAALVLFGIRVRSMGERSRWLVLVYRLLVLALLVSIPIGLLLSRIGSG
jgi:hypothetical protein